MPGQELSQSFVLKVWKARNSGATNKESPRRPLAGVRGPEVLSVPRDGRTGAARTKGAAAGRVRSCRHSGF